MDQVAAYADEEAAALPISTLDEVRAWVATIPFEAGMLMLASIAAKVSGLGEIKAASFSSLTSCGAPDAILEALEAFAPGDRHRQIFAE